ncbi:MAG: twin-arginine translocation signal domain-containing protein [Gammaproteobacteria bacterium]|nr:twin-arginine translocation signal domain-containing protein [Gammaproteobacteria bacterium]
MKNDQRETHIPGRRDFLKGSVAAGLSVAAATSLPSTVAASEGSILKPQEDQGYQLTSHVVDYYKTLAG